VVEEGSGEHKQSPEGSEKILIDRMTFRVLYNCLDDELNDLSVVLHLINSREHENKEERMEKIRQVLLGP